MRHLTRRSVLAGAAAAATTALVPISGLRRAIANEGCLRSLKDFLAEANRQQLTAEQRELIVDQARKLLQGFYVHLPLKETLYGVKPLDRLEAFRQQASKFNSDLPFHAEMMAIFTELRDQHTRYRPPQPFNDAHAFLPFKIEACFENGQRKYIVSKTVDGFAHPTFRPGVEVLRWNGDPIEQAAERAGGEGATRAARHALGLARLTYRLLQLQPVPEEESVQIRYQAGDKEHDVEFSWQVVTIQPSACGTCNEVQQILKFRQFMFGPFDFCTPFANGERFTTPDGDFGYIRIFSFERDLLGDERFVDRFRQNVENLANNTRGLIVDVRDNGGGSTRAGERIIQFINQSSDDIEPSRLYFRATDESLRLCQLGEPVRDLGCNGMDPWVKSIDQAMQNNQTFSEAFHYTCPERANVIGRVYRGPVIVVTSALSYSSAEFFAAGFQDHGGMILGVDETTGGGGAGYRRVSDLNDYFDKGMQPLPFEALPNGADFQVAFRRTRRVGLSAGKDIEDAGVQCNLSYAMTRDDLLHGNRDLKRHAAGLLAQMK